jgi:hypothetical protein
MHKKIFVRVSVLILLLLSLFSCDNKKAEVSKVKVNYAGMRSSTYGIKPFPTVDQWEEWADRMEKEYPGSTGSFVWIVGNVIGGRTKKSCIVNFPLESPIEGVQGFPIDQNKEFLEMCDRRGYSVYLQVEPGDCDLPALAEATMRQYSKYKSVKGFGIDVEWYFPVGTDGWGTPFTDELAKEIDKRIKKVNKKYNYFVKHWTHEWLPPTYRSDMIFVNDSQMHQSLESMKKEFDTWSEIYKDNAIFLQIGYETDEHLWGVFDNPLKELGDYLTADMPMEQEIGIIWVDFTLRSVMGR